MAETAPESHLTRTLQLLAMLHAAPAEGRSSAELAAELGCDERTARRYLAKLRTAGIPVEAVKRGRHRLGRGFFLQPPDLTVQEAGALALAGGASSLPAPLDRPLREAVRKLRAALPHALHGAGVEAAAPGVSVASTPREDGAADDVYARLEDALRRRVSVDCVYEAPGRGPERFRLDPWELHFSRRAWYVTGLHHGRGEPRNLRLSRFAEAVATDAAFEVPPGFTMEGHLGEAWRMIRGGRVFEVRVRFGPGFAETVEATLWHASQDSEWHDDGSATLSFRVDGLDEIVWWVLGYGPGAEVLEPAELRERVAALAADTAARYAAGGTGSAADATAGSVNGEG